MEEFKDSPSALIADMDCTTEGKALCDKNGVRGYPSIKYGEVSELKDYNGGRTFDDLKKFAEENLGPTCGPANLDLCKEADAAKIKKFMDMSVERIDAKIVNALRIVNEEVPLMRKVS